MPRYKTQKRQVAGVTIQCKQWPDCQGCKYVKTCTYYDMKEE